MKRLCYSVFFMLFVAMGIESCHDAATESVETSATIDVRFSGFDISTSTMTRATDVIPENLNRLSLKVFDTEGEEVSSFWQKREDDDFGALSLSIVPGTYTFVCVINEAKASTAEALAAISPAAIVSQEEAIVPGVAARDTYCCVQQVTITSATTSISLTMGDRINARFKLSITDEAPAEVKTLSIVITPDAPKASGGNLSINPSTGLAKTPVCYVGTKSVSGTITDTQIDIYLPETAFTTTVSLEGRNSSGKAIYICNIDRVQFKSNQVTHATGSLFDPATATSAFSFTAADWTTSSITF